MSDSSHSETEHDIPLPAPEGGGMFGNMMPSAAPAGAAPAVVEGPKTPYRVLARKYRPQRFEDMIGQESTVRILRRAFALGRVAHAFMLTGVRGVGKTTTARIIARALNCVGPDGAGGPTADPCGVCANCTAILADRHPDVLEMDAASRTGVDDVREIIEATRFRPMQARMKVFIIDEVHMLSRNAFNALLKTLEEPPSQVTFVFATTELRKVPVTVLSRCQRFDLRRVPQAVLAAHFEGIAEREGVAFSSEAVSLIARAADGSVRDGLSLLDQAIAQGVAEGGAESRVEAPAISAMLGLADRELVFDLLDAVMAGRPDRVLEITDQAYAHGADLGAMLTDLLELVHLVSRLKSVPGLRDSGELPEAERARGAGFADRLSVAVLSRGWQMLLKGVAEVEAAPDRRMAAEMVLLRLCYVAEMPTPDEVIRRLEKGEGPVPSGGGSGGGRPAGGGSGLVQAAYARGEVGRDVPSGGPRAELRLVANGGALTDAVPVGAVEPELQPEGPALRSWREVVAFVAQSRAATLHGQLRNAAHLVRFAPLEIEVRFERGLPPRMDRQLETLLRERTGEPWRIIASGAEGEPTLDEQGAEIVELHRREADRHPLVQAILAAFPTAIVGEVRDHSLDEYGLPPEELAPVETLGGENEVPDLEFAPLDADFLDADDMPTDD